jgi:DNA-binding IclR family transcriptional regulator
VASTSGLVLYAFQPPRVRLEWRKRLAPTVSSKAWRMFEDRAAAARTKKHVRADSDVTRHIVDLSAPVMSGDTVAAALTCPYIETPKALPIKETITAIRQAAGEISAKLTRPSGV